MSRHAEPLREPEVRSGHEARLGEVAGAVCVQADRCLPRPGPAASALACHGPRRRPPAQPAPPPSVQSALARKTRRKGTETPWLGRGGDFEDTRSELAPSSHLKMTVTVVDLWFKMQIRNK